MMPRIVLVEDHTLFADAIERVLMDAGMEVTHIATRGEFAKEVVERERPDLVLMDVNLPDGDGLDIGTDILSSHPETKVMLLTALDDGRRAAKAMKNGFSGYLTKDLPIPQFVSAVQTALAGDVVLRPKLARSLAGERSPEERDAALLFDQLTVREREVLALLVEGSNTRAMSKRLGVSPNTVRTHIQNILMKLHVGSRLEAVTFSIRYGFMAPATHAS